MGLGKEECLRFEDLRAGTFAGRDDRGAGAIAKENARDNVCRGEVPALKGEARKLNGNDQDVLASPGMQKLEGPGKRRCSRGTTKLGNWNPAHIPTKTHAFDQVGIG